MQKATTLLWAGTESGQARSFFSAVLLSPTQILIVLALGLGESWSLFLPDP
jgi:hypothetical protein